MPPQQVSVLTNSFVIKTLPQKTYYQYTITFQPELEKKEAQKRQRLVHALQLKEANIFRPRAIYDGDNLLYSARDIPSTSFRVHGSNQTAPPEAAGWYNILITRTQGGAITPQHFQSVLEGRTNAQSMVAMNLIQLLLLQAQNQDQPADTKKATFFAQGKKVIPRMAVELWHGYHQAVRPSIGKLLVTVDTTIAAMYMSGYLIDVCMSFFGANDVRKLALTDDKDRDFVALSKFLNKKKIYTRTTGMRVKTIRSLEPAPVGQYKFLSKGNGPEMTVADHYRNAHNITLQHPNTIGVVTSGKGSPFKVVVPLELCKMLPGQPYKKKLPPDAGPTVIDFAVSKPQERLQKITGGAHGVESPVKTYGNSEFLAEAGVTVSPAPMTIQGRMLEVPELIYGEDEQKRPQSVKPQNGAWNVLRIKFQSPKKISKWGCINFVNAMPFPHTEKILQELARCMESLGMAVEKPPNGCIFKGNPHSVRNQMVELCQKLQAPDIIIVILPANAEEIRTAVKYYGDVELGVRTQCMRENKLPKDPARGSQYFNNVALKINARLGGCNAIVKSMATKEVMGATFMIVGADVAHPGPGATRPSVASLVWSHDRHGAEYCATSRVQPPRLEIIEELKDMFTSALVMFGNKNKTVPSRIFFYRDGVSEGEFNNVKEKEVNAIKTAIDELWAERKLMFKKPKLTFLIVGKRHHVSFFPVGDNKTGNCKAGLAVDRALENPLFQDFYLQSHSAIKGTSRSAHYTIILDENFGPPEGMPPSEQARAKEAQVLKLQDLSFALCHIYAKATRSVSIPAPVYYADLACSRGKFHVDPKSDMDIDGSTTTGGQSQINMDNWRGAFRNIHPNVNTAMYFL
ncbi:Argonaute-like protein [Mycena kentingensis (nom. inval.)]|nr:Argonaute-like protein [Mycena kentingensis (nom. inval.)]